MLISNCSSYQLIKFENLVENWIALVEMQLAISHLHEERSHYKNAHMAAEQIAHLSCSQFV